MMGLQVATFQMPFESALKVGASCTRFRFFERTLEASSSRAEHYIISEQIVAELLSNALLNYASTSSRYMPSYFDWLETFTAASFKINDVFSDPDAVADEALDFIPIARRRVRLRLRSSQQLAPHLSADEAEDYSN